jgi:3-hydroxybutyrate dehydrogenase
MTSRKTALVTGSTSGIGLGIAGALAAAGHNVMLNGFGDAGAIESLRSRLAADHGVDVRHDGADMAQPAAIAAMMERAIAAFGAVDILVNNAGIQHVAAVDEFPPEKWDAIIAINLSSAFHTTRFALPAMKARGWGRIVNVASAHALIASPFKSAYVAAKHGLAGFTKSVALEVATQGITVNAICPGYVKTPLVEAQIPAQARTRGISEEDVVQKIMLAGQPTRRFIGIDEVAALAAFLASDAAKSITGAMLSIDGGWTAQ